MGENKLLGKNMKQDENNLLFHVQFLIFSQINIYKKMYTPDEMENNHISNFLVHDPHQTIPYKVVYI